MHLNFSFHSFQIGISRVKFTIDPKLEGWLHFLPKINKKKKINTFKIWSKRRCLYFLTQVTNGTGKTNYTGVLSKENLQKAYNEWFLPLRTLVTGIMAENGNDYDQLAFDAVCTLNPVELVLYRCIELVEEKLK